MGEKRKAFAGLAMGVIVLLGWDSFGLSAEGQETKTIVVRWDNDPDDETWNKSFDLTAIELGGDPLSSTAIYKTVPESDESTTETTLELLTGRKYVIRVVGVNQYQVSGDALSVFYDAEAGEIVGPCPDPSAHDESEGLVNIGKERIRDIKHIPDIGMVAITMTGAFVFREDHWEELSSKFYASP